MIIGMAVSVFQKMHLNLIIMNLAEGVLKFQHSNVILDFIKQVLLLLLANFRAKNAKLYLLTRKTEPAHSAGKFQAKLTAFGAKRDIS